MFFKGFGASFAYLQEIGALNKAEQKLASLVEAVDRVMETAPSEVVRVATVDGKVVEETTLLKSAAEKVTGDSTQTMIKVDKMSTFFEKTEFGKSLKGKVQKLRGRQYQGQSIYKIAEKNQSKYLKKGDHFYLDAKHMDHVEVFDANGNFKAVLNLNGEVNVKKTKAARLEGRDIKKRL